ncbi:MAG: 50S ribosomal protein L22 [Phycisphaerales bacterium]|nr:MAG: 50S ribosomal protein L22 [Phycisphaerales bacterium]
MAEQTENRTQWHATHRFARISPRKAKLVMSLIRGRPCHEALDILRFNHRRASGLIAAVLRSAINNAEHAEADVARLVVSEARADGGPYYRRWRPKDRGRAHPIARRTSHLTVRVVET